MVTWVECRFLKLFFHFLHFPAAQSSYPPPFLSLFLVSCSPSLSILTQTQSHSQSRSSDPPHHVTTYCVSSTTSPTAPAVLLRRPLLLLLLLLKQSLVSFFLIFHDPSSNDMGYMTMNLSWRML